jgi:non-heme chloroperoxidase
MRRGSQVLLVVLIAAAAAAAGQSAPKSAFFTTSDGVRIHYLEAGKGPVVVFIPGWTMPAWIWEKQMAHFAPKYHVIAVDPRSQGESDKPADGNYPEGRARDYKELVDQLHLTRPVLVGWSMGVHEVLAYVDQFGSAALGGVVLVDGFLWDQPDPKMTTQVTQWMHAQQRDRRTATTAFVRSMYHQRQDEEYLRRVADASLITPTNTAVVLIYNMIERPDWTPVLVKLAGAKTPVLGMFTTQQKQTADLLQAKVPQARIEIFSDAGHALFVDDAGRFNAVLQRFLEAEPPK